MEYTLLVEIHHPEYLALADLRAIYGAADATGREKSLEALLATAREKAGELIGAAAQAGQPGIGSADDRSERGGFCTD